MFRAHRLFFQNGGDVNSYWMEVHYLAAFDFVGAVKTIGINKNEEVKKIVDAKLAGGSDGWKTLDPFSDNKRKKPLKPVFRKKSKSILDEENLQYNYMNEIQSFESELCLISRNAWHVVSH